MRGNYKNTYNVMANDPFTFFRNGGKKIVNFAITNFCNAKCKYCQFHQEKDKRCVTLNDACRAIDYLCDINVGVLALTGGEPFLNPDLPEIVKYARKKGIITYTGTNGILLNEDLGKELSRADISAIWISFESSSFTVFNTNRGIKGLHKKVKDGVEILNDVGVTNFAICLINKSITDFDKLIERLIELGFVKVKFDYPMNFKLNSSYKGWSSSELLNYRPYEMEIAIKNILRIKQNNKIKVINPISGLRSAIDFYHKKLPKYPCYAGEKILYLDWNLDLYRCPALGDRFGNIKDPNAYNNFERIKCNKCYYQGVRDYDAFYYLLDKFDRVSHGLFDLNYNPIIASLNSDELGKLYHSLYSAWEIRGCGLI